MSAYEFRQKLRRYNILSQKCEVKKTELNLAYKRALKESDDSYRRLSTLAGTTSPRNYTSTALPNTSQFSYSAVSPSKNSLNISRHSPTKSNFNTNTNTHINFNSLLSNSPINKKNSKAEDDILNQNKQEKINASLSPNEKKKDDELEDDQAIFDIIHSKNENSKQSNSDTDEEFQRLVQQADDEENEQKKLEDNHNQKSNEETNVEEEAEEDIDENFEFHPDENEEDINDENEIDFEKKEDGNQFEVDEEEDIHNEEEENRNPFEPDNFNYDDDIKNENHDELFEEEEESAIQSPDKNIIKAIANKVASSNDADQATNKENEAGSIKSNDEVNDQLPTDIQNNSSLSNDDN